MTHIDGCDVMTHIDGCDVMTHIDGCDGMTSRNEGETRVLIKTCTDDYDYISSRPPFVYANAVFV